jgi:hypothetical protein
VVQFGLRLEWNCCRSPSAMVICHSSANSRCSTCSYFQNLKAKIVETGCCKCNSQCSSWWQFSTMQCSSMPSETHHIVMKPPLLTYTSTTSTPLHMETAAKLVRAGLIHTRVLRTSITQGLLSILNLKKGFKEMVAIKYIC